MSGQILLAIQVVIAILQAIVTRNTIGAPFQPLQMRQAALSRRFGSVQLICQTITYRG